MSRFLRICRQSSKKVPIWHKKIFFWKNRKRCQKRRIRWFRIRWKSFEKMYQKKLLAKTWRKNALFSLLLMFVKLVLLIIFFWCIFSQLFQRIRNQREILRFWHLFRLKKKKKFKVILVLFSNFEAKCAKNGSKNQKMYFVNVS